MQYTWRRSHLHVALLAQTRPIRCEAGQSKTNGKFAGWVLLDKEPFEPLVSTAAEYDTREAAIEAMEQLASQLRQIDFALPPGVKVGGDTKDKEQTKGKAVAARPGHVGRPGTQQLVN